MPSEPDATLPRLWTGQRRTYVVLLVCAGLGQAVVAGVGAHVVIHMLRSAHPTHRWVLVGLLVLAAFVVGLLRMFERVVTERLSQDYVHEIRLGLLRRNLSTGLASNLGVAITRTSNDLSSVKSWISQGVAPIVVGVPLIVGASVALYLVDPLLAFSLVPSLLLLGISLRWLTPVAYERARALRKARGRLAGQVADTVLSMRAIRSGGGSTRELNRIHRSSEDLVTAAVRRAKAAGALRGVAATTSGLAAASAVAMGMAAGLPASHLAAALTISGFLVSPMQEFGRAAEFRQTYRAARRIIGPAIEPAGAAEPAAAAEAAEAADVPADPDDASPPSTRSADEPGSELSNPPPEPQATMPRPAAAVVIDGLRLEDGSVMPRLEIGQGERVLLRSGDADLDTAILDRIVGLLPPDGMCALVGSTDLAAATSGRRRRLVGYGAQGMMLAPTTITRAVGYRSSDPPGDEVWDLLASVGLDARVRRLPKGLSTQLRHGGEPLTLRERARITLARALYNEPPLLVFDHLDADLGHEGRGRMWHALAGYPGVVILASDTPDAVMEVTAIWSRDGVRRTPHLIAPSAQSAPGNGARGGLRLVAGEAAE